jgi:hypothetical protein
MILQNNIGFTIADSATIEESSLTNSIFRVGSSLSKKTSENGQSAYLSFLANETKTIALPLGYSSDDKVRFVGKVTGTLSMTIIHPTLGAQVILLKGGGFAITMRIASVSITEVAGTSSTMSWSMMKTETTSTEDFS